MEILSVHNARVKEWSQLLQKKGRDQAGMFIAEGVHLVQEAMKSAFPVHLIAYDIERGWPQELDKPDGIECIAVSPAVLKKCTDAKTPQPVFAIMPKLNWNREATRADGLYVAVDGLQDPGNLGTIIRSADAIGADGVWIRSGGADLYNPKTIRATMGSLFHVPVLEMDRPQFLEHLTKQKQNQMPILGTLLEADKTCYEFDFTKSCCIVIGSEGSGISDDVRPIITDSIKIPMPGQAESLNAAMAATILLFEALRQRKFQS